MDRHSSAGDRGDEEAEHTGNPDQNPSYTSYSAEDGASVAALEVYTQVLPGTVKGATPGRAAGAGFGADSGADGRKDGMEGIEGRKEEMEEMKLEKPPGIVVVVGLDCGSR
ncbi:hypothetical protein B0A48_07073 [Cryoendolithus antarcticus]|uniref:Uncharacterized protein n=1 Tax=Cryoendolithus antarcticus TaxID=1507870 RepID=A0A1V8T7I6_9PEZI|nr:hypothetical protein B0A48_07073 [Cryoendolithus antarcticus]